MRDAEKDKLRQRLVALVQLKERLRQLVPDDSSAAVLRRIEAELAEIRAKLG